MLLRSTLYNDKTGLYQPVGKSWPKENYTGAIWNFCYSKASHKLFNFFFFLDGCLMRQQRTVIKREDRVVVVVLYSRYILER